MSVDVVVAVDIGSPCVDGMHVGATSRAFSMAE